MRKNLSTWLIARIVFASTAITLVGCATSKQSENMMPMMDTPTVDYIETLDVYSAPHKDSFLNQLAMNYRSYAIYNARTSGYSDIGELFANKAISAFSGETPYPESLENWPVDNEQLSFELTSAYNNLLQQLQTDGADKNPQLAAEAQAKFDCWLSAAASGQTKTASQCRARFERALKTLAECEGGCVVSNATPAAPESTPAVSQKSETKFYPDTRNMSAMTDTARTREGVIIVNNVNVPEHLINPVPVQPMVFNQNIYSDKNIIGNEQIDAELQTVIPVEQQEQPIQIEQPAPEPTLGEQYVTRDEFINMMMAMREELAAINARLDKIQATSGEKTMIKVQQIPLTPQQHVMEEVFEVRFDFDKSIIKPEYQELIHQLATTTQENKNIRVSVVGHTDTVGSSNYNYALGGRRAEAVQKMLIQYGIPASQIVAVSAGEEDLAVPTPDNTPNAANRRVRVVKETHSTEIATPQMPVAIEIEEFSDTTCGEYGCEE